MSAAMPRDVDEIAAQGTICVVSGRFAQRDDGQVTASVDGVDDELKRLDASLVLSVSDWVPSPRFEQLALGQWQRARQPFCRRQAAEALVRAVLPVPPHVSRDRGVNQHDSDRHRLLTEELVLQGAE